jgi:hypothetical protein
MSLPPKQRRPASGVLLALSLALAVPLPAGAVVIASGDGSGNTGAPGDDPGFANVGALGSGGAVYLGNRWILTAAHVSTAGGAASFGGISYGFVSGTDTRLNNPGGSGLSGPVDLRMIRLDGDPGLPAVTIGSAAPNSGTDVVMVGRGLSRAASPTTWSVDTAPDPDVWTEGGAMVDAEGFKEFSPKTMRWGENEIDNPSLVVNAGWGDTRSFSTKFDSSGGMTHEAQAAGGDSGGAVFAKNGAAWELIGIMHTVSTFSGQPANTAVFGNDTNAADLSLYADEINSTATAPEPSASLLALAGLSVCLRRRR